MKRDRSIDPLRMTDDRFALYVDGERVRAISRITYYVDGERVRAISRITYQTSSGHSFTVPVDDPPRALPPLGPRDRERAWIDFDHTQAQKRLRRIER